MKNMAGAHLTRALRVHRRGHPGRSTPWRFPSCSFQGEGRDVPVAGQVRSRAVWWWTGGAHAGRKVERTLVAGLCRHLGRAAGRRFQGRHNSHPALARIGALLRVLGTAARGQTCVCDAELNVRNASAEEHMSSRHPSGCT